MKRSNSIYTVLSNLPEFVKDKKIPLKEAPQDERFVYAEAMEGVQQISHDKALIRRPAPTKIRCTTTIEDPQQLLEEAVRDKRKLNVTNMPEYMEGYAEGINPVTLDKLKNSEFSIQKTLDLHGFSLEDAQKTFEEFITDSIKNGLNCVKVVHGRGLKSRNVPVLKDNLKSWIIRAINRKWVTAFSSARMCDGGPGATCILLNKKPVKKRIHILG
jgi:DNA-nicking Smr family endonuclease